MEQITAAAKLHDDIGRLWFEHRVVEANAARMFERAEQVRLAFDVEVGFTCL